MSDFLVEAGRNPQMRKAISALGLPLSLPQALARPSGPWTEQPLQDKNVLIASPGGALSEALAVALAPMGANPWVVAYDDASLAPFAGPGEAYGRPAKGIGLEDEIDVRPNALIFDATGLTQVSELEAVHRFFRPRVRALARCGRVIVLARPPQGPGSIEAGVAARAFGGFIRSVGKEIGRYGSTANLIHVAEGAEGRLAAALRFFLSGRSAFVSGQEITLTDAVKASEPRWVRPLEGKVALITGAARGIGAATARAMSAEGATVLVLDRPADDGPASQVARELGAPAPLLFDITDPDTPAGLVEALKAHGGADIIVHNAGITRDKTLGRMKPDWWDLALDVNLGAVVRTTHAILESGALNEHGRVICLTSVAGLAGNVGQTNYATAKAGLVEFVRRLGAELAPSGSTANAIAPGFIETRMTAAIPPVTREAGRRLSSLSQGGLPEDVANALTFLASPGADGINGQVLRVCGGSFLGA